jgi:hypothetical protein
MFPCFAAEIRREREPQIVAELIKSTKMCECAERNVLALVGLPIRSRDIVVVGNITAKIPDPISAGRSGRRQ